MISFFGYILKVSTCIGIFYLFYLLVLRNNTFFRLNRFYLLTGLLASFLIPIFDLPFIASKPPEFVSALFGMTSPESEDMFLGSWQAANRIEWLHDDSVLTLLYISGFLFLLFKRFLSITKAILLKRKAQIIPSKKYIFLKSDSDVPFTFFNRIFLPSGGCNPLVIDHELVHLKQRHWIDLVIIETVSLFHWFNPFVYLYKAALKLQHEYLADSDVIRHGNPIEEYLECMLQNVKKVSLAGFTSHFYCKTVKKRIIMITKNKSSYKLLGLYGLVIPLIFFMLLGFTAVKDHSHMDTESDESKENMPSIYPINRREIQAVNDYGEWTNPISHKKAFHAALDFAAPEGETVVSAAYGTVLQSGFDGENGMGNYILIIHSENYSTFYAHLKSISVRAGDVVKIGERIGYVGSTGKSTGPHLHYEVIKNGSRVNPKSFLPQ